MRQDPNSLFCFMCVGVCLLLYSPLRDDERVHEQVGWVPSVHVCVCVSETVCVCLKTERLEVFAAEQRGKVDQ